MIDTSYSFVPHAVCWRQDQSLIWTMATTNAITFLSYSSICATLLYLARKTRRVIVRDWAYFIVGFALFIVACGSTHLMEVITTWVPVFWIDAWTNIVTAILSAYVAVQFFRRAQTIGFGINDYADSLSRAEMENSAIQESLLAARRMEEWNRMSAVVSHEINNPLETIQNLLHLIRESIGVSPEIAEFADKSAEEVERVISLTRSTLGFFREGVEPEPVNLRASAESVLFVLDPQLREKKIDLIVADAGDCTVDAYSVEIRQVLLNLVRNACEASTRIGSRIWITMAGRADAVDLVVEDEAGGIDPAALKNLFQFGTSTKGEQGNGMGLWVVKQFMDRHAGTIKVESNPGVGTRFSLTWPRRFVGVANRRETAGVTEFQAAPAALTSSASTNLSS